MATPSLVNYNVYAPKTIRHKVRDVQINTIGMYNQNLGTNDVVKFPLPETGFMDPYATRLEITIETNTNTMLNDNASVTGINHVLQIDNSASSFFSTFVATVGGKEVERINNYDVIVAQLNDLNYTTDDRFARDYEGLGGIYTQSPPASVSTARTPFIANSGNYKSVAYWHPAEPLNCYYDNSSSSIAFQDPTSVNSGNLSGFPLTTSKYTINHVQIGQQLAPNPVTNINACTFGAGSIPTEYYNNYSDPLTSSTPGFSDPQYMGCSNHFTPSFCQNGFEPFFSPTLYQRYLKSGVVKTDPLTSATFNVPLYSGIFGCLMKPQNFKLIPLKYMKDTELELTINPFAMFTSFPSTNNSARGYTIKNLILHTKIIEIEDPAILESIEAEYQNGIKIPTQTYTQGPSTIIAAGASIPPSVQINLGFQSLNHLLISFIPNDYMMNTFCRKNYRLSMNVTSLQVKVGIDYIPPFAIRGNGGTNFGPSSNAWFIRTLLETFNKHIQSANTVINPHNFAVNFRAVDPALGGTNTVFDRSGLALYEENRVIGKAIYAINFAPSNYEGGIVAGINTLDTKPFELLQTNDMTKSFPRAVTEYIFCNHDIVLNISPNGVDVIGRA